MASKSGVDKFANIASISVTESAANTLTFKKLETGIALFDKIAWVIHRLETYLSIPDAGLLNSDTDSLFFGLTASNTVSTLLNGATQTDPSIFYGGRWRRSDFGTAATAILHLAPWVIDFTNLPGGGLIVPPSPLYGAAQGSGCAAASTVIFRLYYTNLPLSPDEYWELVESRRMISA